MRLTRHLSLLAFCSAALFLGACGGGGTSPLPGPGGDQNPIPSQAEDTPVELSLAAGMTEIMPIESTVSPSVDLGRFGISGFDRVYEVTTPVGQDFGFTLVARSPGNSGDTRISVGHGADGGQTPLGGAETIAGAGIFVDGAGISYNDQWVDANGDGFARISVNGNIDSDQVLVVRVPQPDDKPDEIIGVCVGIGEESEINQEESTVALGATLEDSIIYSSDSYQFGLPAIAVSGDRYSIVTYDGDESDPFAWGRSRRWLQYDANTQITTGGEADSASYDVGNWRNQEVAAKDNVLAIVATDAMGVSLDISLDRGASFGETEVLSASAGLFGQNLVNVAIAEDYTIGVIYWESDVTDFRNQSSRLMVVEGTPSGFDQNNTPTGYDFGNPSALQSLDGWITPLLMNLAYSDAGDLVIGYGFTAVETATDAPFAASTASFRCATRMDGSPTFNDVLVDQEEGVLPMDPSVALIGSGGTMQVFFAYERTEGVFLAHSSDGGASFTHVTSVGEAGAFMPSVHAREQNGDIRVDLLFLNPTSKGLELHNLHWDVFDPTGAGSTLEALTQATRNVVEDNVGTNHWLPFAKTVEIHDVAWFGFDAVTDGDDVAVVVHEQDRTSFDFMNVGLPVFGGAFGFPGAEADANAPQGAGAAVLLPGLNAPVEAPDGNDRNQLRLIVLD